MLANMCPDKRIGVRKNSLRPQAEESRSSVAQEHNARKLFVSLICHSIVCWFNLIFIILFFIHCIFCGAERDLQH